MRRFSLIVALLCIGLVGVPQVWGQGGTGQMAGTVSDASGAVIPGVEVTALNTGTNITTTVITNNTGSYTIGGLTLGNYELTASLPGFQTNRVENIELTGNPLRFNFTLTVAGGQQTVDVVIDAQQLLVESNATIGDILPANRVTELPIVGNDVLDLIGVLGGVRVSGFGETSNFTTLAGVSGSYANTTVNGLTVGDQRYGGAGGDLFGANITGIYSTTQINPDLVQEVRLILTPVDAEMGRGNSQIQINTRSGTNDFQGALRWDNRNPALNARSWEDNRNPNGLPPVNWYNQNQFSVSYGGPIIENKTFFFALWDQNINRTRTNVVNSVLTPCARNGFYRFFPYWNNGNANATTVSGGANPTRASVGIDGTPIDPQAAGWMRPDGSFYTDDGTAGGTPLGLEYASVYGRIDPTFNLANAAPDCSNIPLMPGVGTTSNANTWDPVRFNQDPTGFVTQTLGEMPLPNEFDGGDGLNVAQFRWIRGRDGDDDASGIAGQGNGNDVNRKQLNLKVDHVFSQEHKVSVSWQTEWDTAQNEAPQWETGFYGYVRRRPHTLSANFNSTLSPTMVNEAVFGITRQNVDSTEALDDAKFGDAAQAFAANINGIPVVINQQIIGNPMSSSGDFSRGNVTNFWTIRDNLSWTFGAHSLKFGGETRLTSSDGWSNLNLYPRVSNGSGQNTILAGNPDGYTDFEDVFDLDAQYGNGDLDYFQTNNNVGGGGSEGGVNDLLLFQSGSIDNIQQLYFLESGDQLANFENVSRTAVRGRDWEQHEAAFFAKDDWKITRDLTLNLGLRWEYYGTPFEANGLMPVPIGGGLDGGIGISGTDWDNGWFQTNPTANAGLTTLEFVGPNSPNPDRALFKRDANNLGPAVGFAWQVPWFGQGRTTVRGGYQVTFQGGGRTVNYDLDLGYIPGSTFTPSLNGTPTTYARLADFQANPGDTFKDLVTTAPAVAPAFDFADYPYNTVVPLPETSPGVALKPLEAIPLGDRDDSLVVYDPNRVAPYIQNFTLSITRSLGRNMTVDVRYVGTRGVKLFGDLPINQSNYVTNGLLQAFTDARAGIDNGLLNTIFAPVLNPGQTAMEYMALDTDFRTNLATGNFGGLANTLATANETVPSTTPGLVGDQGWLLQAAGMPLNFTVANPQFNNVTYDTNSENSTYHALQAQFTLRPTLGINYQGTFTWAKQMTTPGDGGWSFIGDRSNDHGLGFQDRRLDFRSNGTFVLPIGPGKPLLGNSSGWLARVVEDWRFSTIFQITSGRPLGIDAENRMYGGPDNPDISPEGYLYFGENWLKLNPGEVTWEDGADAGNYWADTQFERVSDPQCAGVAALPSGGPNTLLSRCNTGLEALAVVTGNVGDPLTSPYETMLPSGAPGVLIFQQPEPFTEGDDGNFVFEGPGLWLLHGSLAKSFQINEDFNLQVRFDARNLLNHPTPDDVGLPWCTGVGTNDALASGGLFSANGPFGQIGGKCVAESTEREFQGGLRLTF